MRLALVAGEASGDLLAGLLLGGLKQRWPALQTFGIGGPRMAEHGFSAWWPHDKLAVRGYVEVLRHYREIKGIRDALGDRLLVDKPDAFIGVDAPDFNLGLEHRLRAAGVKAIHFVCPSIWAWRAGRVEKIARSVDHVLCLFPFEAALLRQHGIAATYVGHPLADAIPIEVPRASARTALGFDDAQPLIAVLPGSRRSEIQAILPTFAATVSQLAQSRPELRFVLPVAPGLRSLVEQHIGSAPMTLLDGHSHEALAACDATLIASGTATLEAALFKRPMVIAYKMNARVLADHEAHAVATLGRPAQHPVRRVRRARAHSGRRNTRATRRRCAGLARCAAARRPIARALHRTAPPVAARHRPHRHRCDRADHGPSLGRSPGAGARRG